jgi:hypothetical protein
MVQSEIREERPVRKDTHKVRAVQPVVREERTAPASHLSEGEERKVICRDLFYYQWAECNSILERS